jgi:hypothetical protein
LAKGHYVRVFGGDLVRETQGTYVVRYDEISFSYSTGWAGIPPQKGRLLTLPGIDVIRAVAELTDEDAGAVILIIRVRWWLLLLANAAPILLAYLLARPMLRRRHVPGHCRACGYDLRASTGRCPECGTEIPESAQIDKQ